MRETAVSRPDSADPARLLYGHAGSPDTAQELAQLAGVHRLPELGDVIVVEPLGFLRLMTAGAGRAQQHHDGSITVYRADGGGITLWPCLPRLPHR